MDMKYSFRSYEPRPGLAIRVGFVGHRDLEAYDADALGMLIHTILGDIRRQLDTEYQTWGYADTKPVCYLINSLAEGADQLGAKISQKPELRFQLRVPVPFSPEKYTAYFQYQADESRAGFNSLVSEDNAKVINLECSHESTEQRRLAYRAAADVLLENSDILIAVCDPARSIEAGGTIETVRLAEKSNIPVVLIDPNTPSTATLVICDEDQVRCEFSLESLEKQLRNILAPHALETVDRKNTGIKDRLRRCFISPDKAVEREKKKATNYPVGNVSFGSH